MKSLKINVVIVTYNGMEWIENCLKSLSNTTIPVSVIVVDNSSTDGTIEFIKTNFQDVILLQQNENLGFGKANNIGIKKAYYSGADYVFLLNQDAWVTPDAIENLIKAHQKEPEYGITSPMHLNGKGDALDYNFSNYINPIKCKKIYSDIFLNTIQEKIYKTEFVNAAAWLISRKCIGIVGGFNPSFFHYGEDDNYVHRVQFHQFKVGVCPHSIIYHDREINFENKYFKDEKKAYTRSVVLKISNPTNEYTFEKEYRKWYSFFCKSLILFRSKKIKEALWKIKILNHLDKKQIIKNKLETYKTQPSFLN